MLQKSNLSLLQHIQTSNQTNDKSQITDEHENLKIYHIPIVKVKTKIAESI